MNILHLNRENINIVAVSCYLLSNVALCNSESTSEGLENAIRPTGFYCDTSITLEPWKDGL